MKTKTLDSTNMDSIKVEPNLEADTNPLVSPDEEKCVNVKEEECSLPAQIGLVKEEVIEESCDHTTEKEEVKQQKSNDDIIEQMVSHEDGNNCDARNKLCLDAPAEETQVELAK